MVVAEKVAAAAVVGLVGELKPSDPARPGKTHRVYLRPEVNGALEAYREAQGGIAVNQVLLRLVEGLLVEQGYLVPKSARKERR